MRTARFWIRWNGDWVKLALQPGEAIDLHSSESTEEGWRSEWERYEYDGTEVTCDSATRERDCDSVYTSDAFYTCNADELASVACDGLGLPLWRDLRSSNRDHSAEAAGY